LTADFLHGTISPALSAIGLRLEILRMDYEQEAGLSGRIASIQTAVDSLMEEVRSFSNRLAATPL
jgi:hypothetical protein